VRRHVERAVNEAVLAPTGFLSDGSSLQEWSYGTARVVFGMNPTATAADAPAVTPSAETRYFEEVFVQLGHAYKQHVRSTYDAFVHLRNELPVTNDGHRPMNDGFRSRCDAMVLSAVRESGIRVHEIGGTVTERLDTIVRLFGLPTVMDVDQAVREGPPGLRRTGPAPGDGTSGVGMTGPGARRRSSTSTRH